MTPEDANEPVPPPHSENSQPGPRLGPKQVGLGSSHRDENLESRERLSKGLVCCRAEKDSWDKVIAIVEVIALIVLTVYTWKTWQIAGANNKAAKAAESAAETAAYTLRELQKGGADTHDLATAAGKQAEAAVIAGEAGRDQVKKLQASVEQMAKLTEAAQQATERETRPWLDPVEVGGTGVETFATKQFREGHDAAVLTVRFDLKFKNLGQSTATFGPPQFALFEIETMKQVNVREAETVMCKRAEEGLRPFPSRYLASIFPHDDLITRTITARSEPSFRDSQESVEYGRYRALVGCIAYQGPGRSIYHTSIMYIVVYSDETLRSSDDNIAYRKVTELKQWFVEAD